MIKKIITFLLVITPFTLFAADGETNYDIVERTVNFLIFVAIIYYLLADVLKRFFKGRTEGIQSELNKVQEMVKESEKKVSDAKKEIEEAQRIANELVSSAKGDVDTIKSKIEASVENEVTYLTKSFDDKSNLEMKKLKKEVVEEVLNELLGSDNITLSQEELTNIVLKKVA